MFAAPINLEFGMDKHSLSYWLILDLIIYFYIFGPVFFVIDINPGYVVGQTKILSMDDDHLHFYPEIKSEWQLAHASESPIFYFR